MAIIMPHSCMRIVHVSTMEQGRPGQAVCVRVANGRPVVGLACAKVHWTGPTRLGDSGYRPIAAATSTTFILFKLTPEPGPGWAPVDYITAYLTLTQCRE